MNSLAPTSGSFRVFTVPDCVTAPAPFCLGMFGTPTIRANFAERSDSGMSAFPRAILGGSFYSAYIELFAALGTSKRTAGITNRGSRRPGPELLSTLCAGFALPDNGQTSIPHQIWMLPVKRLLSSAVAYIAQCHKVVKTISLLIGLEQVKRLDVMHREMVNASAMLAGVPVTLKYLFPLVVPVCAAIVNVAALPDWTLRASKAPLAPFCITGIGAERVCPGNVVWFALKLLSALVARQSNHT